MVWLSIGIGIAAGVIFSLAYRRKMKKMIVLISLLFLFYFCVTNFSFGSYLLNREKYTITDTKIYEIHHTRRGLADTALTESRYVVDAAVYEEEGDPITIGIDEYGKAVRTNIIFSSGDVVLLSILLTMIVFCTLYREE